MKTICAIIKDEHNFLREWIDWHLTLGFDSIHLFEDKGSKSHEDLVKQYDNVFLRRYEDDEEIQTLLQGDNFHNRQYLIYSWFCETTDVDWVAFIDIDEFIIFEEGWNLEKLCTHFQDYPALYLFWKMKGASGHVHKPKCGVMEAYTIDSPFISSDIGWNCKSFVNINKREGLRTIHHANGAVRTDGTEGEEPIYEKVWINHYFTKSWDDWCDRIYNRGDVACNNRTLHQFFECNPDMEPLKDKLIDSVSERIPFGTYWLDKNKGLIAGGNTKTIEQLNKRITD